MAADDEVRRELVLVAATALRDAEGGRGMPSAGMSFMAGIVVDALLKRLTPVDHCSWCGIEDDVETEGHRFALLRKDEEGVHEQTNRCVYTPVCQPLYRKVQG